MPNFTILLGPSESKVEGGNPLAPDMFDYRSSTTFNYFHELNPDRRRLIEALQKTIDKGKVDLEELLGVKGSGLEAAVAANREILNAPLMAALERYSPGTMYKAMDFSSLPTGAQRRLLENGVIFSGLFGLLRPDDLIPNYRLRMDATLPGIGKVSHYWRDRLSKSLNDRLEGRMVWNLLPGAQLEAWDDARTYKEMIIVRFYDQKKGKRTPVSQGVKPLRGRLVSYIVSESGEEMEALTEWTHPDGYRIDLDAMTFDEDAKCRTLVMVKNKR